MAKLIMLTALLIFVYQFDELVKAVRYVAYKLRKKRYKEIFLDNDHHVGTVLALAGLPLALNYLVYSERPLAVNLAWVAGALLLFAALSFAARLLDERAKYGPAAYSFVGVVHALLGAFQPVWRTFAWQTGRAQAKLASLAVLLSLPALAGLGFRMYFGAHYEPELAKYLDVLIIVMVGGSFIHLTTQIVRNYLRRHRLGGLSYLRIIVGLAIFTALLIV